MRRPSSGRQYDLVVVLNYYTPYVSGLTAVARAIAEGCAARGWRVHVVTSRYDRRLARHETINGVSVERTRVVARVRNGVVSPAFPFVAAWRGRRARVANLHLPMLEAGLVAVLVGGLAAGLGRRPSTITTYQCDYVTGDDSRLGRLIRATIDRSSRLAFRRSRHVVVTSTDYARSSRVYSSMRAKVVVITPPFTPRPGGHPTYRESAGLHVGTLGRVVHEKGLDVLVTAFRRFDDPEARLLIGGDYDQIAGPSVIHGLRRLAAGDDRIRFLGYVPDARVNDYFASLDVLAFPSVNSLEAFGISQVEAISAGVPVIASDLPGVRVPVARTGFGLLVAPGDADALLDAIRQVPTLELQPPALDLPDAVDAYVRLFEEAAMPARRG